MLESAGVPTPEINTYLGVLGNREALDACLNWYRAAGSSALGDWGCPPVSVPTLYLWGDCDATVGREAAESTEAFVKADYRFVAIEGAGHFLTDDRAGEQVTREIVEHLERCSAAATPALA